MSLFVYSRSLPEGCRAVISPSQIEKFFTYPKIWYEDNMTDNPPSFTGNTSSVLGTICHHIYNCVTTDKPVARAEIDKELDEFYKDDPNVDVEEVKRLYPLVTSAVVNNYILERDKFFKNSTLCECPISYHIKEGIYLVGTFDRLEDNRVLCDYKNVSTKPSEATIPFKYKIQLLAYAYALKKAKGIDVETIRVIYGVRPTKTIEARCIVVSEAIEDDSWKLIEDTLELMADSILAVQDHPELTYLIFKSMELKNA